MQSLSEIGNNTLSWVSIDVVCICAEIFSDDVVAFRAQAFCGCVVCLCA